MMKAALLVTAVVGHILWLCVAIWNMLGISSSESSLATFYATEGISATKADIFGQAFIQFAALSFGEYMLLLLLLAVMWFAFRAAQGKASASVMGLATTVVHAVWGMFASIALLASTMSLAGLHRQYASRGQKLPVNSLFIETVQSLACILIAAYIFGLLVLALVKAVHSMLAGRLEP